MANLNVWQRLECEGRSWGEKLAYFMFHVKPPCMISSPFGVLYQGLAQRFFLIRIGFFSRRRRFGWDVGARGRARKRKGPGGRSGRIPGPASAGAGR